MLHACSFDAASHTNFTLMWRRVIGSPPVKPGRMAPFASENIGDLRVRLSPTAGNVKVTFVLPVDLTARGCSAVGDFNGWQPGAHQMRRRSNNGQRHMHRQWAGAGVDTGGTQRAPAPTAPHTHRGDDQVEKSTYPRSRSNHAIDARVGAPFAAALTAVLWITSELSTELL